MIDGSVVELIERGFSASLFDTDFRLANLEIERLAVRSPEAKARLLDLAF